MVQLVEYPTKQEALCAKARREMLRVPEIQIYTSHVIDVLRIRLLVCRVGGAFILFDGNVEMALCLIKELGCPVWVAHPAEADLVVSAWQRWVENGVE